jgi:hypothetical protein
VCEEQVQCTILFIRLEIGNVLDPLSEEGGLRTLFAQKRREATLSAIDTREIDETSDHISVLFADCVAMTPCPIAFKVCAAERCLIMHAALLHDPSGSSILRFAFSDDSTRSEHAKLIREHCSLQVTVPQEATSRAFS